MQSLAFKTCVEILLALANLAEPQLVPMLHANEDKCGSVQQKTASEYLMEDAWLGLSFISWQASHNHIFIHHGVCMNMGEYFLF